MTEVASEILRILNGEDGISAFVGHLLSEGGPGSGHFHHQGRPGARGGRAPSGRTPSGQMKFALNRPAPQAMIRTKPQIRAWRKRRENAALLQRAVDKYGTTGANRPARRAADRAAVAAAAIRGEPLPRRSAALAKTPAAIKAWRTRRANAAVADQPAGSAQMSMPSRFVRIEKELSTTKISSVERIPDSKKGFTDDAYIVKYADGSKAIYKEPMKKQGRDLVPIGHEPVREAAAWEVAKIVGMDDMVPPTILKSPDGKLPVGSIMRWVPHAVKANDAKEHGLDKFDGAKDAARAAVFDYVTGQSDRHGGNWLLKENDNKMILIDHGFGFPIKDAYQWGNRQLQKENRGKPIPDDVKAAWKGKWAAIQTSLTRIGLEPPAIESMRTRYNKLMNPKTHTLPPQQDRYERRSELRADRLKRLPFG